MEPLRNFLVTLALLFVPAFAVNFRKYKHAANLVIKVLIIPIVVASSIPKCNSGDNECVARSFQGILQHHTSGVPQIGLGSIDPMHFTNLDISIGGQGSVAGNLTITTGKIKGWKAMEVKKVSYV